MSDTGKSAGRIAARAAAAASGTVRQRRGGAGGTGGTATRARATGGGGGAGMNTGGLWRFYTEDSTGLKIGPVPVLVMSLVFIASVFVLHIWGKYSRSH
ncbi:sec61beta family domain-containing protein [Ditylenchus destructor]|uniref:Protein transport protein Sec61 subunit beta n=1 Tax=Ditylenchus destructor TaxID=166010 RepID=A0AAD4NL02_9BILA|nr:sec61beta family domain-containing protein [Ditylenchus destructor]